jgi:hypothetical protein
VLYCAGKFKKVKGDAEMAQVIAALEAEHASATGSDEEDSVRQSGGASQKTFNGRIVNFGSSFMPWSCPHDQQR